MQRLGSKTAEQLEICNSGAGALIWGRGEGLLEQGGTSEAHGVRTVEGLQNLLRDVRFIPRSLRAAEASQGGSSRQRAGENVSCSCLQWGGCVAFTSGGQWGGRQVDGPVEQSWGSKLIWERERPVLTIYSFALIPPAE